MIICVDPNESARSDTRAALADAGFETRGGASVADATAIFETLNPADIECVVTEYDLSDGTGIDLISEARDVAPDATCVLFTAAELDQSVFEGTVAEYLSKDLPDARDHLVTLVQDSLTRHSQTAYPVPDEETYRVDALDHYADALNTLTPALDRLTELAQLVFDTSSAAVGLIDAHHERFLACSGASFETLDREETVCTYTILDEGPLVVEDLREDPRFSDNETLAEANIRFYAGVPLVTANGHAIGTLCLQHDEPRSFSEREQRMLSLLADEVMDQLRLRTELDSRDEGNDE